MPNPTTRSGLGLSAVSVAVRDPADAVTKLWDAAPFLLMLPVNVSVTVTGGDGATGVGSSSPQAASGAMHPASASVPKNGPHSLDGNCHCRKHPQNVEPTAKRNVKRFAGWN